MDDEIPFNVGGFQVHSDALRELFAEGLGTFVLTVLGCSGNARYFLSQDIGADLIAIPWIWGLAYTIGVYVSGGVSGGHLNPAVTLGLASVGKLSWSKVPHYFFAQYVGAFLGAGTVYGVYSEAITSRIELHSAMTLNMTTKIFIPVAGSGVSTATQFIDQVTCCTIFLLLINAVIDERNLTCSRGLKPLLIGFIGLSSIVFTFGYNAGAAVNPARDLAPRLLIWLIGWGPIVFNFDEVGHFWVPLLGCHIGGMLGSWLYRLLIENHWPDDYNISSMVAHDHHGKYNYNDKYFMNKSLSRVRPV